MDYYQDMENTKRITLTLATEGWLATTHGPDAAQIKDLFGTTTLPTAFTSSASRDQVRAAIMRLNPGYEVE